MGGGGGGHKTDAQVGRCDLAAQTLILFEDITLLIFYPI